MLFEQAGEYIINRLTSELPAHYTYHDVNHTMDVYRSAERIARAERINDSDIRLLLTAAWYHDTGFLISPDGHEEQSCKIAEQVLPEFEYTPAEINIICGLIWATRMPQTPLTQLEKILADADLDYLGREDFGEISNNLYRELAFAGKVTDIHQWNLLQIQFVQSHHYFTQTAINTRQAQKDINLAHIKSQIK